MADEQQPTKKVVKRVVRNTVAKKPAAPEEIIRFGRPAIKALGWPKAAAIAGLLAGEFLLARLHVRQLRITSFLADSGHTDRRTR